MKLRDYQLEAVEASFDFLRRGGRAGLVVAPTGSGKSAILAAQVEQIVGQWGARCLIATHRAELIRQDERAIVRYWPDGRDRVGVYSAGLGRREMRSCTVAGVQSVARRAGELGHVDVVLIDEAHLVSPKSDTQYGRLLSTLREVNPDLAVLGLTATPTGGDQQTQLLRVWEIWDREANMVEFATRALRFLSDTLQQAHA